MEKLLSIVLPCHNEEANLAELYRRCTEAFEPTESLQCLEIIVVNDGSTDRTLEVAKELADDPRVRVISFSRNFGKESAMLAGLQAARGDAAIIMDSDLQHPPRLIPAMMESYEQGYHQVIAKRNRSGDSEIRSWFSQLYYRTFSRLMDVPLEDSAGDFRLLSRRAIDALTSMMEYNRFSKGMYSWIGLSATTISYANEQRYGGETSWSFTHLLNYGISGIVAFNDKPLRVAIKIGLFAFTIFVIYLIFLMVSVFTVGIEVPGYITTIAVIVGVGGIQLAFLGVLGEYVGKIYSEVKGRPHYVIEEEIGGRR